MIKGQSNSTPLVVGIGTSAGGLVALEAFFSHALADSGIAYIVVQHLDPTKKALLPELLQRVTTMTVRSARHNQLIKPDHVYIIPPNRELTVQSGKLILAPSSEVGGLRLPVNVLFHSLALEYADRAVGVVLSGMGSDGALGVQEIKRSGGFTLTQTPDSAQFDSMPSSAIHSNCVDVVDLCEALPHHIRDFAQGAPLKSKPLISVPEDDGSELKAILSLLRARTRHDFSSYKPAHCTGGLSVELQCTDWKARSSMQHFFETIRAK